MSIGEVSKAIGITRRIILNYEAKGLLLPDKKEGTAGNRYYTPDSISLIRSIRVLQNLGLSLDEISSYYNGSTDLEPLIERLEALRDGLTQSIEKLKQRTASPAASVIQFLTLPAQTVYCRKGAFNGLKRNLINQEYYDKFLQICKKFNLPIEFEGPSEEEVLSIMKTDKKNSFSKINMILPTEHGKVGLFNDIDDETILEIIKECKNA